MPFPPRPDPLKHCEICGEKMSRKRRPNGSLESMSYFARKRFCSNKCKGLSIASKPLSERSKEYSCTHYHARRLVPIGPCRKCGKENASDVHHIDGDHTNNVLDNLERLCRSCHLRHHRPKVPFCTVCGDKAWARGFCGTHYRRFRVHGDPNLTKIKRPRNPNRQSAIR